MDQESQGEQPGNRNGNTPGITGDCPVISYNLNEGERPGGLKVRYKIRVESGKKAAARDAMLADAVKELLQWSLQNRQRSR
jgi:hypothetical protein